MCYVILINKHKCIFGTRPGSLKQMKMKFILALWDENVSHLQKTNLLESYQSEIIPFVTLKAYKLYCQILMVIVILLDLLHYLLLLICVKSPKTESALQV